MKRKTNLFYLNGPDSKFLTFSNYTEALTGNFLSTDTKLFPDKFLCLKLHNLNSKNKSDFIKYLVKYYENKLAVLRDDCISNDIMAESNILPLSYLLEAILNVCSENSNEFTIDNDLLNSPRMLRKNVFKNINENGRLITYIGDITEEDYNGTYTDIICTINANSYYEGNINYVENIYNHESRVATIDSLIYNKLHGWENEQIFDEYESLNPAYDVYDETTNLYSYNYESYLENIEYIKQPEKSNVYKNIKFNIIIPLFSITNMNYNTNDSILEKEFNDDENEILKLNTNIIKSDNVKGRRDIPLGIWLYADDIEDSFIELKRDTELNIYPSWSLLIASQFKPFPYSLKYEKENDILKSSGQAYATFAETLTKMNDVLDKFNSINVNITRLDNKINSIERKLKEIGISSTVSKLETQLLNLENSVKNDISDLKKEMYGYIDNITWSSKYKNNN